MTDHFKQSAKNETEKLRRMSGKDRIWYIWEYYKFPIALCLAAVLAAGYIISILYGRSFDTILTCYVIESVEEGRTEDAGDAEEGAAWLERELHQYLELGKKEQVSVDTSLLMSGEAGTSDYVFASMARISAAVSAGKLDVIIGDRTVMEYYGALGALEPLPDAGEDMPWAVSIQGLPALEQAGIHIPDPWFALVKGSSQTEYGRRMLQFLTETP